MSNLPRKAIVQERVQLEDGHQDIVDQSTVVFKSQLELFDIVADHCVTVEDWKRSRQGGWLLYGPADRIPGLRECYNIPVIWLPDVTEQEVDELVEMLP